jgi:hypothetical protein
MFPIAPQIYPRWFAQSSTLMYLNQKGELYWSTFVFILQLGSKRVLLLVSAQFSKKLDDGPINMTPSNNNNNNNKIVSTPMN